MTAYLRDLANSVGKCLPPCLVVVGVLGTALILTREPQQITYIYTMF